MNPVPNFELSKYLGKWYEIARLPAWFEKDMTHVTATYSTKQNGKVKVENAGFVKGKSKRSIGKAKFAGNSTIGYLKVSFFGPFYADYKILLLDSNYQYAIVASSEKYLWILSRESKLDEYVLKELLKKVDQFGFNTDKLYFTPQN